jgi:hypothetical protein
MGVFWESYAEVVSTEPETTKKLIEEIIQEYENLDEKITSVFNIKVEKNSVFFNSKGYGCYGTSFENESSAQLFEILFSRYENSLIAFEHVHPCQGQGYHFNALWAKPEGEFDWDDETTYFIYRRMVSDDEVNEDFDASDVWYASLEELEKKAESLPMLFALVQKAKEEGFDEWLKGEFIADYLSQSEARYINDELVFQLIDNYWDSSEENGDSIYCPSNDIDRDMNEWVNVPDDVLDQAEFEMPEDFPMLSAFEK